jgi:hypothetical protein
MDGLSRYAKQSGQFRGFDPRRHDLERIIDALAIALLIGGAVEVPDAV